MERYAFVHFGPNTFTDREWGEGREDPKVFNPTNLDCKQWVRVLKAAGFKGVIATAKHHDGFCLWPSKYSTHTVAQSPWKDGKGDVLKDLSAACKAGGLKLGIYLSPWDRNHPNYGTPAYNQTFANMLREVLTNYGPIFEVWFDGANGEGPNGKKQVYDWPLFIKTVRECQPNAVIFSDGGPDIRWVGNEDGIAGETNWSTIHADRYMPGTPLYKELTEGTEGGHDWVPAECDVSIRPGWFYHQSQDDKVKSPKMLEDLYLASVGRNGSLLLNVPPDRTGQINEHDVTALMGFQKRFKETYGKDLAKGATVTDESNGKGQTLTDGRDDTYWVASHDGPQLITLDLHKEVVFDRVELREPIQFGQRISSFRISVRAGGDWSEVAKGTTIGNKRILPIKPVKADQVRIEILDSLARPMLREVALYASPEAKATAVPETQAQRDKRMAWWREARFGMFIHWGLYSVPAGEWKGKNVPGAAEWLQYSAQIPPSDYEPLREQFNPVNFDAKKWVKIAKDAGMKYIVITSKHHEGFGMWPGKQGDWNIGHTQFKRDPLKELAVACKEAGIKLCFYHSIMDWHNIDYIPRQRYDKRPVQVANLDKYVSYMKAQLKELLTGYGPIGLLWFDGEWENTWNHERGRDLYNYIRKLQPEIIVNNRVDVGRSGMAGLSDDGNAGDYGTPEQEIPANGLPGVDWESCMTMNDTWGFHKNDNNWKSADTLIRNVIECASKGGNYLLNVGPTSLGEIPEPSAERLAKVGKWMSNNGAAIYGTQAGPFTKPLPWGRVTRRGELLYLCVFKGNNSVELPGLDTQIVKAYTLVGNETREVRKTQDGYVVNATPTVDEPVTVIVVETAGPITVVPTALRQSEDGKVLLMANDATVHGQNARVESDKGAIGYWTNPLDTVDWSFVVRKGGQFAVQIELACDSGSQGSTFEVSVGETKLVGHVPSTGSWSTFTVLNLGQATVGEGKITLTVRPLDMPNGAVMNLRSVKLIPLDQAASR